MRKTENRTEFVIVVCTFGFSLDEKKKTLARLLIKILVYKYIYLIYMFALSEAFSCGPKNLRFFNQCTNVNIPVVMEEKSFGHPAIQYYILHTYMAAY